MESPQGSQDDSGLSNRRGSRSPGQKREGHPDARGFSPTTVRRGTVADVRSLSRTAKICIEGFMEIKSGATWNKFWFVLDASSPDLKGYGKRPLTDMDRQVISIPLEDVSQVVRVDSSARKKEVVFMFHLMDASNSNVATFRCADNSNLLWWLHGFQRRIFEQTKGILRKMKRKGQDKNASSTPEKIPSEETTTTSPSTSGMEEIPRLPRSVTVANIVQHLHHEVVHPKSNAQWFHVTSAAQQGRRKNMEDETLIVVDVNTKENLAVDEYGALSVVAIFDGHAGRECAEYASEFMVQNLLESEPFKRKDIPGALQSAFVVTDKEFRAWAVENENISGTTALVVVIRNREVYVANSGDCRCVLSRKKKAFELSVDHKPQRPDEKERIESAGGWIETQEVLNIPKLYAMGLEHTEILEETKELVGWVLVHKVCGALAMTRSFGDVLIKDMLTDNFECTLEEGFAGPLILAEPELKADIINPIEDEFLIMACDGLWDVFSSQEAVDFVLEELRNKTPRDEIADKIITVAIARGTLDNVSVVILYFH